MATAICSFHSFVRLLTRCTRLRFQYAYFVNATLFCVTSHCSFKCCGKLIMKCSKGAKRKAKKIELSFWTLLLKWSISVIEMSYLHAVYLQQTRASNTKKWVGNFLLQLFHRISGLAQQTAPFPFGIYLPMQLNRQMSSNNRRKDVYYFAVHCRP